MIDFTTSAAKDLPAPNPKTVQITRMEWVLTTDITILKLHYFTTSGDNYRRVFPPCVFALKYMVKSFDTLPHDICMWSTV